MNKKKFNDYELIYLVRRHSEEALEFLFKKYEVLIDIKLHAFHVSQTQYNDFKQECFLSLDKAIRNFSEEFNKSFYRYVELIIDRKIMNLLRSEGYYLSHFVLAEDFDMYPSKDDLEKNVSYVNMIEMIKKVKFIGIKEAIINEVFFNGMPIEEFSLKHDVDKKDVYNHIYLLRNKLKKDLF